VAHPNAILIQGDARSIPLRDASMHCVVTSPPYWGLRDYGLGPETLGLEATPELYVQHLVEIFREVRRVLRPDGTCWVNLGDSYVSHPAGQCADPFKTSGLAGISGASYRADRTELRARNMEKRFTGLKPKDLVGIPWRVAFALQADGWWLRSDIIWAKPNPMPESITDRPTKAHEYLFLLTKAARYYYDGDAIREPQISPDNRDDPGSRNGVSRPEYEGVRPGGPLTRERIPMRDRLWNPAGRNRRSVWTIATEPYPEAHFATFPEKLVEPCILAGTSARGACPTCGAPWGRVMERTAGDTEAMERPKLTAGMQSKTSTFSLSGNGSQEWAERGSRHTTLGWSPSCACDDHVLAGDIDPPIPVVPCRVLDPFAGSGTTVAVAERLGRVGLGLELNPAYLTLARQRTVQAGLL
jgi:DNA modification methylase